MDGSAALCWNHLEIYKEKHHYSDEITDNKHVAKILRPYYLLRCDAEGVI